MENFNQIFTLISEGTKIGLNSDILETGLINILALLGILIYAGKDFLNSLLEERKEIIVKNVQDAEYRLTEAEKRLEEAKKQLSQLDIIINGIKNDTIVTKKNLLKMDSLESQNDLINQFEQAIALYYSKERQVLLELRQQILFDLLKRVVQRAQRLFAKEKNRAILLNSIIKRLNKGEFKWE